MVNQVFSQKPCVTVYTYHCIKCSHCYYGYIVLLCTGGYGFVFIAQDVRNNKLYALKVSDKIITH